MDIRVLKAGDTGGKSNVPYSLFEALFQQFFITTIILASCDADSPLIKQKKIALDMLIFHL